MTVFRNVVGTRMAVPSTSTQTKVVEPPKTHSGVRDLYDELRPLWWVLLLVLTAPIQRSKSGLIQVRWSSWSGILTLGIFTLNCLVVYHVFPAQYKAFKHSETFHEQVFASLFLFTLNVHFMGPITAWPFSKKLADYLNNWTDFQENYYKVTGRQLEIRLWNLGRTLTIVCAMQVPQTIAQFMSISDAPVWHAVAYVPVAAQSIAVVGAWHCNCAALRSAAERMSEDFVSTASSESIGNHVEQYRKLWNSLHKLSVGLSKALSAVLLQVILTLMSMHLISAFGVLGAVVAGVAANRVIVMLTLAAVTHIQLLFVCSAGYQVAEKINMAMRSQLLNLSKRRSLVDEHELNLFLKDITLHPACIRIIGYLDINRLVYIKIIAAVARNFLVLLQFAYTGAKAAVKPTDISRDDFYDFL